MKEELKKYAEGLNIKKSKKDTGILNKKKAASYVTRNFGDVIKKLSDK